MVFFNLPFLVAAVSAMNVNIGSKLGGFSIYSVVIYGTDYRKTIDLFVRDC